MRALQLGDDIVSLSVHPTAPIVSVGQVTGHLALYKYSEQDDQTEQLWRTRRHKASCRATDFSTDGNSKEDDSIFADGLVALISCGADRVIKAANVSSGKATSKHLDAHEDEINAIEFVDESVYCSGDDSGVLKLWDLRKQDAIAESDHHFDYISSIHALHPRSFVTTSGDGTLSVIDPRKFNKPVQCEDQEHDLMDCCSIRGDTRLAVGQIDGVMTFFKAGDWGDNVDRMLPPQSEFSIDKMISFRDRIVVGTSEGALWDVSVLPNRYTRVIGEHSQQDAVQGLNVSHNEQYLISASGNEVRWWPTENASVGTGSDEDDSSCSEKDSDDSDSESGLTKNKRRKKMKLAKRPPPPRQTAPVFKGLD